MVTTGREGEGEGWRRREEKGEGREGENGRER